MPNLAGQSNVTFRMAFGSGNTCLNFDGFAFDNVYIGEAPSNFASFAHGCASGIPLTYNFINTSAMCPTTHAWDFGDPNSGINNTSILLNPQHTFSTPGTYTVTLTESGPGNAPHTTSKIITTVDLNPNITPPSCTGDDDAKVQMVALNMYNPQLHTLNTGASTNNSPYVFSNLAAGTYTVTSQGADNCMITVKPNCISNTGGEISVFGTGGTGAYTYSSGSTFVNTSTLQPLSSGTYTVTLKDANGCTNTSVVELEQEGKPVINDIDILPVRCFNGDDGKVEVIATSSVSTVTSFSITPNAQQQSLGVFVGMNPGTYTIQVQDAQGCTESTLVELTNPDEIKLVTAKNRIFVCKPTVDTVMYTTQGGTPEYKYILQPNYIINNDGIFKDVPIGNYIVQVYDANECKAELPLKVEEGDCCSDIFIPTAFTPNGDGMNDLFKMNIFGTVLINKFQIVNRLGETVFNNEVTQGWDGYHKGSESPQDTYYYIIMYTCRNGKAFTRMGEVSLLR
jgi:gliding motility-associated-like protein